jgi:hypothetical protein
MTKVFPHDFEPVYSRYKEFNVRFVPNVINDRDIGNSIVIAYKNYKSAITAIRSTPTWQGRKSLVYLSYAIVNPFDSFNSYLHDTISVIRYGKNTLDKLSSFFNRDINPFDLSSEVSFLFKLKQENGMTFFEIDQVIESKHNKIYDEFHPGKNDKEVIAKFLQNRDKHIEILALQLSDDEYKPEVMETYKSIIRGYKIGQLI